MKSEHEIQNEIRLALSNNNCLVFRTNVGKVQMKDGRWFDTGLPKGFTDLMGCRLSDGKIFFIEVKNKKGTVRDAQKIFIDRMKKYGLIAGVARSPEQALKIVLGDNNV